MDVMVLKKNMGERCGIKLLLMFTVLYLLYGTTNATQTTHCPEGTYLYYSKYNHICLTCPHETFMPLKQHTETSCYDCTKIKDPTVDIVVKPCNKVFDTDIQCVDGYYRRLARNPHSCNKCSSTCAEDYIQVHPCKNFTDIGCCFHENYDETGLRKCSSRPSMCSRGQYLDTRVNDCRPCPNKTFMSEDYHSHTRCWDCQPILDTDLPLHVIITEPCTSTRPPQYGCQDGYYINHGTSYRGDDITCSSCQTCDEGKYVGQQCNMYHDTVCCDKPNTAVAYIPHGGQCIEIIGEPHLHPYVGKLRVKQGYCQSVMCFVALEREKNKPDLTWEGPNVGQHQQFQYEEQNNETGMTVYHNTLTLCNFSAADVGQYRCRDNLWILRIDTLLDIVLACKDGSYNPPDCDKSCSQHCRPSERSDVSLCDNNSGTCLFGCVDGYTGDTCETVQYTKEGGDTSVGYVSTIVVLVILMLVLIAVVITCVIYNKHCQGSGPLWWQRLVRHIFTQPKRTVAEDIEQRQPLIVEPMRYDKKHDEDQYEVDADTTGTQLRQRRGIPENMGENSTGKKDRSINTVKEEVQMAVEKLQQMKVFRSQDGIECLEFISQTFLPLPTFWDYSDYQQVIGDWLADLGFAGTCIKILRDELQERKLKDNNIWSVIKYTYMTCGNYSGYSTKFAKRLAESGAVHFMSNILRQQHYLDNLDRQRETQVVKDSIDVLHNIALKLGKIPVFQDCKTVEVLMTLISSNNENIKVRAMLALVEIVEEKEIESIIVKLNITSDLIDYIVEWIYQAVNNKPERRYEGITADTLTRLLARLAVADVNRTMTVMNNAGQLNVCTSCHIKIIIREEIQEFPHLVSTMEQLKDSDDSNVRQSVRRALCKIKGEKEELLDEIKEDIKTAARRLEQMTDYHSKDVIKSLRIINHTYIDYPSYRTDIGDLLCDFSYPETCIEILRKELSETNLEDDNIWLLIYNTYSVCHNYTDSSMKFAKRLVESGAVQVMSNILRQQHYLDNLNKERGQRVVDGSLGVLHNIALKMGNITEFRDSNTVEVVMPYTNSNDDNIKVTAVCTLAHIVEEEEKDKLLDKSDAILLTLLWIPMALDDKDRRCMGFPAWELTAGLARLAVNNLNKRKIVEEKGLDIFLTMLTHAEPVTKELHWTAQCVGQLAHDQNIKETIRAHVRLVQALKDLKDSADVDVKESVRNALLMIRG